MSRLARLSFVLGLNLVLVAGLLIAALAAHSLGVLAESADYLADAAAIGVAILAARMPSRRRAPAIAALVNAGWLLVVCVVVTADACYRLATGPSKVHGLTVLVVSGVAATVMLAGALVLGDDDDLSMRAVLLDTAADAAAAAGVAIAGGIILETGGWYWLDPAVALAVAVVIGLHAVALLREVVAALR